MLRHHKKKRTESHNIYAAAKIRSNMSYITWKANHVVQDPAFVQQILLGKAGNSWLCEHKNARCMIEEHLISVIYAVMARGQQGK